ncbi:hypothetical protein [Streptomyces sp. ISL-86]|uniref:hypothetical protein n=1 Tax=Streptomyces sp. ISL-86 TaxID=2819187 RepID=UPI001BE6E1BD|nr:hypothetical protein [Streptomyces sp. ISL-86]MBT2454694.1 hypothetical protein [Streptomyces sp. ISL-86]
MNMSDSGVGRGTRGMRGARGVLALVVVAGGLTGCSLLSPFTTCRGTGPALERLAGYPVLEARPEGAAAPPGADGAGEADGAVASECLDDSGDAWMYARRVYVAPVGRGEVLRFYREAAAADGWKEARNSSGVPADVAGLCFSRGGEGNWRELDLSFMPASEAKEFYGYEPPADPRAETFYSIEVGAGVDGERLDC